MSSNKYIKIYTTHPCWFAHLDTKELDLVLHMANLAEYDESFGGMVVFMNTHRKKKLAELMGLQSHASVANIIVGLIKKEILYRVDRSIYAINPNLLSCSDNRGVENTKEYFPSTEEWLGKYAKRAQ